MSNNLDDIKDIERMDSPNWNSINPEYVQRMRLQNQFKSGIDIAKYTSSIMRKDMDAYDNNHENYTCLLYTSPSPRDGLLSRMPSSA